jgi:enoyl-CoA hydratase
VSFERVTRDGIATLALNRPPVNALDLETVVRLGAAFAEIAADPPEVGLVLSGVGRCFCAGVDTRAFGSYDRDGRARMILAISAMVAELYALPCPVVSAVTGHALGGGFVLMLGGDVRLAVEDDDIKLGLTEASAGIPFPAGPLEIIAASLAPDLLRRLTLTSQTLTPTELLSLGVIDALSSAADLPAKAEARVRDLATQPGFTLVKEQVRRATLSRLRTIVASGMDPLIETLESALRREPRAP